MLFVILWWFAQRVRPRGAVSGVFLVGYGVFRSIGELFRNPDEGIFGVLTLGVSMGQWLSLPMILAGIGMLIWSYRRRIG